MLKLIELRRKAKGEVIDEHLKSASSNKLDLQQCKSALNKEATRVALGLAAKSGKTPWFKSITAMEAIAFNIIGPDLPAAEAAFASRQQSVPAGQ